MTDIPVSPQAYEEFCLKHGAKIVNGVCLVCEVEQNRIYNDPIRYMPVFVGKTDDGEKVVLYRTWDDKFHIKCGDGELWALSPGADLVTWDDMDEFVHMRVKSPEWSGEAKGSRRDLLDEEGIR